MNKYSTPSYVQTMIAKQKYAVKKRFGQNFLIDQNYVDKIVAAAEIEPHDWVLEIGPGFGGLTNSLAKVAKRVVALEIDWDLVTILKDTLACPNVDIINCDALKIDWEEVLGEVGWQGEPVRLVANLPYYITSPLVMKALEGNLKLQTIVVMVQKEVASRMTTHPGTKDHGVLSLAIDYYSEASLVTNVPRNVFFPVPDVQSAVVKLLPRPASVDAPKEELFVVIKTAFMQRRKTIRKALRSLADAWQITPEQYALAFSDSGIDPSVRGERLSLQEFSNLTNSLVNRRQGV